MRPEYRSRLLRRPDREDTPVRGDVFLPQPATRSSGDPPPRLQRLTPSPPVPPTRLANVCAIPNLVPASSASESDPLFFGWAKLPVLDIEGRSIRDHPTPFALSRPAVPLRGVDRGWTMAKSETEFIHRPDVDGTLAVFLAKKARSAFRAGNQKTYFSWLEAAACNSFSEVETKHGVGYVFEDKSWLWVEKGTWFINETIVPPFADTQTCGMGSGKECVCALCDEKSIRTESASDNREGAASGRVRPRSPRKSPASEPVVKNRTRPASEIGVRPVGKNRRSATRVRPCRSV